MGTRRFGFDKRTLKVVEIAADQDPDEVLNRGWQRPRDSLAMRPDGMDADIAAAAIVGRTEAGKIRASADDVKGPAGRCIVSGIISEYDWARIKLPRQSRNAFWQVGDLQRDDISLIDVRFEEAGVRSLFGLPSSIASPTSMRHEQSTRRLGRRKGSGSFAKKDEPLVAEMVRLVESQDVNSPNEAAKNLAGRAAGPGTPESRQRRLMERYRNRNAPKI